MTRSKRNIETGSSKPQPKPARAAWLRLALLLALLFAGGIATGYTLGLRHAPLGANIPPAPKSPFITAGVEIKDSSVNKNKFSVKILDRLAPQPDGASPLDGRIPSERGGYAMVYPWGAQLVNLPPEIFAKDGLDVQVNFKYDQPLFLLNASMIRRKQEQSYWDIAQAQAQTQMRAGAQVSSVTQFDAQSGCPFARFEFTLKGPEGDQEFRQVFVGPYGGYCLVFDFMAKARHASQARALTQKIVATFSSDWRADKRLIAADTQPQH
jgi:hypothetical protein